MTSLLFHIGSSAISTETYQMPGLDVENIERLVKLHRNLYGAYMKSKVFKFCESIYLQYIYHRTKFELSWLNPLNR